ncbi:adenylosuccinate synthase [Myxococcota bacterium]|nr:adenylosuccinate synthase [Myxococcota bacterium]
MTDCLTIVGVQWGDEGKGKITDLLADRADIVARYQGGANAGHTVVVRGGKVVLHQIPSGILNSRSLCLIGPAVVLDPATILLEMKELLSAGWDVSPARLRISSSAQVVMPYHKTLDSLREASRTKGRIGTTGRGIGPAYEDLVSRAGIRLRDLCNPELLRERLEALLPERNAVLTFHSGTAVTVQQMLEWAAPLAEVLAPYQADTGKLISDSLAAGGKVLFESAQGTLLDVVHGTYPFVTSSYTTAPAAFPLSGVGASRNGRVLAVVKAYTTRVGEGPFPTEDFGEFGKRLRANGHEFGATTGRPRRCGALDLPALRYTFRVNGVTSIALTKMDVLGGFTAFPVCVAYRLPDGTISREMTADSLMQGTPVYEDWQGWNDDIATAHSVTDLPVAARDFILRLESELGVPVDIVSTAPDREATIVVNDIWQS